MDNVRGEGARPDDHSDLVRSHQTLIAITTQPANLGSELGAWHKMHNVELLSIRGE